MKYGISSEEWEAADYYHDLQRADMDPAVFRVNGEVVTLQEFEEWLRAQQEAG